MNFLKERWRALTLTGRCAIYGLLSAVLGLIAVFSGAKHPEYFFYLVLYFNILAAIYEARK